MASVQPCFPAVGKTAVTLDISLKLYAVRIVEEELIAVRIIDHQQPVAPPTLLDRCAPALELCAQRVQRSDRGLVRLRLRPSERRSEK